MSDPRNQAQADRASASRRGEKPQDISFVGRKTSTSPCSHGTVTFTGPAGESPYPGCAPQWRPPL